MDTLVELIHKVPFQMWKVFFFIEYTSGFLSMTSSDILFLFICSRRSRFMHVMIYDLAHLFRLNNINRCLLVCLFIWFIDILYLIQSFYLELEWVVFLHSSPFIIIYYIWYLAAVWVFISIKHIQSAHLFINNNTLWTHSPKIGDLSIWKPKITYCISNMKNSPSSVWII